MFRAVSEGPRIVREDKEGAGFRSAFRTFAAYRGREKRAVVLYGQSGGASEKGCNPLEKRERAEKIRERMNMKAEMHCQTQVFSYTIGKSKGEAYAELFR